MSGMFVVARNPQEDSRLPYLVRLPLEGGIALKARDRWPATARVYCHRFEEAWPSDAEIVEQAAVLLCRRRGPAIDLVLDRPRQARSQFVFTQVKGREAIFWQTQKTVRAANPGARIPRRRVLTDQSRSVSTPASATPTGSPGNTLRRSGRPSAPATTPCTRPTERSLPRSSGRASTTLPRRSPTDHSRSNCNDWPSFLSPRSSSRPATALCSSSTTSTATGSPTNSPGSRSATPTCSSSSPTARGVRKLGRVGGAGFPGR
jgi:hypothetical protein